MQVGTSIPEREPISALSQELEQKEHKLSEAIEEQEVGLMSISCIINSLHSNRLGTFFVGAVFAYVCLQACRVRLQKTTIQSEHMKRWAVPWMDTYRSSGMLNTIIMNHVGTKKFDRPNGASHGGSIVESMWNPTKAS